MKKFSFFSPTFFGLVLMSFFLTFFDLKCNKESLAKVTGIDLVTGKNIDMPSLGDEFEDAFSADDKDDDDNSEKKSTSSKKQAKNESFDVPSNMFAIVALILALVGMAAYFVPNKKNSQIISFLAGIVGIMSLIILKSNLENKMNQSLPGKSDTPGLNISADLEIGFYLAIFFFAAAAIWNIIALNQQKETFLTSIDTSENDA